MNGITPMTRVCSNCGEERRCRFTGIRWICGQCWSSLFPRDDAA